MEKTRRRVRVMRRGWASVLGLALMALPCAVAGQTGIGAAEVRDEMMGRFEVAMGKFIALAEAMPPESYTWSPMEGVMEVGQVYMHVVRYNYLYPTQNMGLEAPPGLRMEEMEGVRAKEEVIRALRASMDWVREAVAGLDSGELQGETQLYGRTVPRWKVLVQLVSHMNEHLGQSIAYARMNGIVPPWSR